MIYEFEVIWIKDSVLVTKYVALDTDAIEEMAKQDMEEGFLEIIDGIRPGIRLI